MTIKEFSRKYNIPYYLAYKASYNFTPVSTYRRDREYSEEEMLIETHNYISGMAESYRKKADQYDKILEGMMNT